MHSQEVKTQPVTHPLSGLTRYVGRWNLGSLPVLFGLILIAAVFQFANPNFLTPLNLTNLFGSRSSCSARPWPPVGAF